VGASAWRVRPDGRFGLYPWLRRAVPEARGAAVAADHRPAWPWLVLWAGEPLMIAAICYSTVLLAVAGRRGWVRHSWLAYFVVGVAGVLAAACELVRRGELREGGCALLFALPFVTIGLGTALVERFLVKTFLAYCTAGLAAHLIQDCVYGFDAGVYVATVLPSQYPGIALVMLGILLFRSVVIWRAFQMLAHDEGRYNRLWAGVLASGSELHGLLAVRQEVAALARSCNPRAVPRQLNRLHCNYAPRSSSSWGWQALLLQLGVGRNGRAARDLIDEDGNWDPWGTGIEGALDPCWPLDSMDQLFLHAGCLHPILIRKVQAWGLQSGGFFRCVLIVPILAVCMSGCCCSAVTIYNHCTMSAVSFQISCKLI
jgi:hypothetical protein